MPANSPHAGKRPAKDAKGSKGSDRSRAAGRGPAGGQFAFAREREEERPMDGAMGRASGTLFRQAREQAMGRAAGGIAVSSPGDRLEREADGHGQALARGESVAVSAAAGPGFALHRMCAGCDAEEKRKRGAAGRGTGGSEPSRSGGAVAEPRSAQSEANWHAAGDYARNLSGGEPLSRQARAYFEPRMGRDLSRVRIHRDAGAQRASEALRARAFTYGSHIAFARGAYHPESSEGKRLLGHELTHVAQQGDGLARSIQRELATPPPAAAPAAQADLTDPQIQEAIRFNSRRFDETHTRQIQDIVGTAQTGTFNEDDIRAIARVQEEYGLTKDGKIGPDTYRWLVTEIQNEGLDITNENCPVAFWVDLGPENITPLANGADMTRHFTMNADFPSYCNCADYEYRQFIRGHFDHTQGATTHDMRSWLADEPSGTLTRAFTEDGNTRVASVFFGHRNRASAPDDLYLNDANRSDRANGCRYRGDDTPGGQYRGFRSVGGVNVVPATGDRIDILIQFRGEIRFRGTTIITKFWTALRRNFVLP